MKNFKPLKHRLTSVLGIALLTPLLSSTSRAEPQEVAAPLIHIQNACGASEAIQFNEHITPFWQKAYATTLGKSQKTAQGFSQALAFRKMMQTDPEARILGEYWIAHSMWDAKLVHLAFRAFSMVAGQSDNTSTQATNQSRSDPRTAPLRIAALGCLAELHAQYPSLTYPPDVITQLPELRRLATTSSEKEATARALTQRLIEAIGQGPQHTKEIREELILLNGSGDWHLLANLLVSASHFDHSRTTAQASELLLRAGLPPEIEKQRDHIHLLNAHALFSLQRYAEAATELKAIKKQSNDLARALSQMSWVYLLNEQYNDSIGSAVSLQAGGMRRTFAPEGPMVLAMAFNELCQFPESLSAVSQFKREYEQPFRWLDHWSKNPNQPLYPIVLDVLKTHKGVPDRIANEWLRSPLFIANQEEINLIYDEKESAESVNQQAVNQLTKLGLNILSNWKDLKTKIQTERQFLKPGDILSEGLRQRIADLKAEVNLYKQIHVAVPAWRSIMNSNRQRMTDRRTVLVSEVNRHLSDVTLSMYTQLQEIAENNQLIEVEIYNGASQDIIWQNAHPEFKEMAKRLQDEEKKQPADQVWYWGRMPSQVNAENSKQEIWEDELGSFKTNVIDNCSSKEKYLAIKRRGA